MTFHIVLLLFQLILETSGIPIDNGLIGEPRVTCGSNQITVSFVVEKPFAGNIYTKGFYKKEECRLRGTFEKTEIDFAVPVNFECGMRRKRVLSPQRGLVLEATVVLMFHPVFLTKIDKSYHVHCLYMEADKPVTQVIDVSTLPPDNIGGNEQQDQYSSMPSCQYEVLRGGPQGSPLKYATIGESVYHKWSCSGKHTDLYCMTVHSCIADDGMGFGQQLLDQQGCSVDKFLLNNLEYLDDVTAGQEAHVFKFADRPTIFFGCQIRLELKEELGGQCQRLVCPEPLNSGGSHPVDTPSREKTPIEMDFPRPTSARTLAYDPDEIPPPPTPPPTMDGNSIMADATELNDDLPPVDLRNFDKLIYRRLSNKKRFSREVQKPVVSYDTRKSGGFHVDVDVIGAVEVLDGPSMNSLQPLISEVNHGHTVCIAQSALFLSGFMVLSCVVVCILFYSMMQSRKRYAECSDDECHARRGRRSEYKIG